MNPNIHQHDKQAKRRFTGEALTGFGSIDAEHTSLVSLDGAQVLASYVVSDGQKADATTEPFPLSVTVLNVSIQGVDVDAQCFAGWQVRAWEQFIKQEIEQ